MFLSIPKSYYANVSQLNKHEIPFREKKKKEEERMIQKKPREVNVTKSAAIQEYIQ